LSVSITFCLVTGFNKLPHNNSFAALLRNGHKAACRNEIRVGLQAPESLVSAVQNYIPVKAVLCGGN